VAVVGAGPAGSMAARCSAMAGARTLILEEHKAVGYPVQCAGLLGLKALEEACLGESSFRLMPFCGAKIHSPGGGCISFRASTPRAWAVDRRLFDRSMALSALASGADLELGAHVRKVAFAPDRASLELAGGEEISARVVISAEGVGGRLARAAGIPPPEKILSGAQVEVPFEAEDLDSVELYLGAAPGLFAWVIPAGENYARIGLCCRKSACEYLRSFLRGKEIRSRLRGSPLGIMAGGLPLGPSRSTAVSGLLAVGDSAGQVKPTSGGGIYPGLVCAKIAGKVAAEAAIEGDPSLKRLSSYDREWRRAVGRELFVGMRLNRMIEALRPEELDYLVEYISRRDDLLRMIEEVGDIDRPSQLLARMLPAIGFDGLRMAGIFRKALWG